MLDGKMSYNCTIKELPAQPTLAIRTHASVQELPQVLGKAYGTIAQYIGAMGKAPAGAPYVGYFNMDMQNLDMEIGFPVAQGIPGNSEVQPSEIPAGKYAACLYTGPYGEIEAGYNALMDWMHQQGYKEPGTSYELYLNDPAQTAPQDLQTEILFPLGSV
jgi:effector-binding domain-containing protein